MKEGNIAIDPSTHLCTRAHVYAYISGTLTNCYNKLEREIQELGKEKE